MRKKEITFFDLQRCHWSPIWGGFGGSDSSSLVAKEVRLWVVTPGFNSAFFGKIPPNGSGFKK